MEGAGADPTASGAIRVAGSMSSVLWENPSLSPNRRVPPLPARDRAAVNGRITSAALMAPR